MPRTCTICASPQHQAIDQALVAGTPYRAVAERFAASPPSVYRHQQGHLPATMLKAREAQEVAHADGLLAQLQSLQQKALEILARAEGMGDLRSALAALRELRGTVELTAKLTDRSDGGARRSGHPDCSVPAIQGLVLRGSGGLGRKAGPVARLAETLETAP